MQTPTELQREAIVLLDTIHRALALVGVYSDEALCWVRNELLCERHLSDERKVREAIIAYIDEEIDGRKD